MPSNYNCMAMEIVLVGLSKTRHLCLLAVSLANAPMSSKQAFLSFLSSRIVDLPIDRRVMKRSTMGLPLALPGYLDETA
jgi:hypothetical protein